MTNDSDFLYGTADVAIWSCCEGGLAITAACCATLRPMFRRFLSQTKLSPVRPSERRGEAGAVELAIETPGRRRGAVVYTMDTMSLASRSEFGDERYRQHKSTVSNVTVKELASSVSRRTG